MLDTCRRQNTNAETIGNCNFISAIESLDTGLKAELWGWEMLFAMFSQEEKRPSHLFF